MKNPVELWNDLTTLGKVFSWWIFPTYYLTILFKYVVAIVFYGVFSAYKD